mgnify:CR=1 FL=1
MIRRISYKKLWKLLIDKGMTRTQLRQKSGISTVSLAKLGKDESVTTDILLKVCNALNCDISDIMETVHDKEQR